MTGDISLDSLEERVYNLQLQMEALQASKATPPKLWEEQKRSIDAKLAENKRYIMKMFKLLTQRKKVQGLSETVEVISTTSTPKIEINEVNVQAGNDVAAKFEIVITKQTLIHHEYCNMVSKLSNDLPRSLVSWFYDSNTGRI
ncbi:hypothetical protein J1N35_039993 [Gossypium stocksii]|uniref:Uncharacterized protein n=1 Tax=Gossypium stocksii TaxID=47602 RepID=A0A9D3UCT9_9ROSI|nr:hypothetical protein J1N35_039993 [Gossypium stocksii]